MGNKHKRKEEEAKGVKGGEKDEERKGRPSVTWKGGRRKKKT